LKAETKTIGDQPELRAFLLQAGQNVLAAKTGGCTHPAWRPTGKVWHFSGRRLTPSQKRLQGKEIFECVHCGTSRALKVSKPKWEKLAR
jgi:hypothetical protein